MYKNAVFKHKFSGMKITKSIGIVQLFFFGGGGGWSEQSFCLFLEQSHDTVFKHCMRIGYMYEQVLIPVDLSSIPYIFL